jgi:hypothetical protein
MVELRRGAARMLHCRDHSIDGCVLTPFSLASARRPTAPKLSSNSNNCQRGSSGVGSARSAHSNVGLRRIAVIERPCERNISSIAPHSDPGGRVCGAHVSRIECEPSGALRPVKIDFHNCVEVRRAQRVCVDGSVARRNAGGTQHRDCDMREVAADALALLECIGGRRMRPCTAGFKASVACTQSAMPAARV